MAVQVLIPYGQLIHCKYGGLACIIILLPLVAATSPNIAVNTFDGKMRGLPELQNHTCRSHWTHSRADQRATTCAYQACVSSASAACGWEQATH